MSSAGVIQARDTFTPAPIRHMPFGKYRGRPLKALPPDYLEWLLGREIDDRLRTALKGIRGTARADGNGTASSSGSGPDDDVALIRQFLAARAAANEAKRRLLELRERLVPVLRERGGYCVDEASGQRLSVEERLRWEYDLTLLHGLVENGVLAEEEFASCLKTDVDKNVVAECYVRGGCLKNRSRG